jgi:hypothetical protein
MMWCGVLRCDAMRSNATQIIKIIFAFPVCQKPVEAIYVEFGIDISYAENCSWTTEQLLMTLIS